MPIKIDGRTFRSHKSAVRYIKRKKPGIKNPDAYVATIERKQHGDRKKKRGW